MNFAIFLIVVAVLILAAGRLGLFAGSTPERLGVQDGKLKPPSKTPNSVTSQADLWPDAPQRDYARVAPLPLRGDAPATIARVAQVVASMPGARIVERRDDYLYAQFTTPILRFVDDVEFWVDPAAGVLQVRSASRVGRSDLGVNRTRIETIRELLARP
jgi:uncharacterized protein (DUF1499 family)